MGLFARLFNRLPTRDAFARMMMREIRAGGSGGEIHFDAENYRLRFGDETNYLNLSNAYRNYCEAPRGDRRAVLQRFASLRAVQDQEEQSFEVARANLLPRVQSRFYHEVVRQTFSQFKPEPGVEPDVIPHQVFAEKLAVDLVYDHPQSIQTVSKKSLEKWGVTFDQAMTAARENLWRRSNETWHTVMPGVHVSPWHDTHDAARMYLHDLIWQLPVKGQHVAIAANRVSLIVTGSKDEEGLAAAAAIAEKAFEFDRIISGVAFRLDGKVWTPWLPEVSHVAHFPLNKLATKTAAMDYAEQKKMLDAANEKSGLDQFIAKVTVHKLRERSVFTLASWTDGVNDALLPEADVVAMARFISEKEGAALLGYVKFERLKEVAADLLEPTDHYPPRYRTRKFPTAEQLIQIGISADPPV
jgi:hypothetical protein